jgi:hypothetical protein
MMKVSPSETSIKIYQDTRCYIPGRREKSNLTFPDQCLTNADESATVLKFSLLLHGVSQ